jgi:hypothetical protein
LENAFSLCLFNFFLFVRSTLPFPIFYSTAAAQFLFPSPLPYGLLLLPSAYLHLIIPPPPSFPFIGLPFPSSTFHHPLGRLAPGQSPFTTCPISSSSRPKCAHIVGWMAMAAGGFYKKKEERGMERRGGGGQTGQGSQGQRPPSPTKLLRPFASAVGFPPNSCAYLLLPLPLFIFPLGRPSLSPSPCMSFYPISLFVVTI